MKKANLSNPYRVLEGGVHYGTKEKFPSYQERFDFLTKYAAEAKRIYEEYKENPERIEDEEKRKKFEQFSLYQQFESEIMLVEIFRAKVKEACRIASLIKEAEEEKISPEELKNLQIRFAIAKAEVNKLINSLGPLLELAHRKVNKKESVYDEFLYLNKKKQNLRF